MSVQRFLRPCWVASLDVDTTQYGYEESPYQHSDQIDRPIVCICIGLPEQVAFGSFVHRAASNVENENTVSFDGK